MTEMNATQIQRYVLELYVAPPLALYTVLNILEILKMPIFY